MSSSLPEGGEHITDTEIAAYLDRTLTEAQRERIENHLAECPECRQHLLETAEVLKRVRRPRKSLVAGVLAAAAAAFVIITRPSQDVFDQPALMRSENGVAPIAVYGPLGPAPAGPIRFIWSSTPDVESYRLTLSRADAATVWSSSGTDTVVSLPDSVILRPGQHYHWVVDALLRDGTSRSTGLREFTVIR